MQVKRRRTLGGGRRPRVSVIVPCFNAEETVGKTLASLQKQSFKDFEVIVVDDGSTDKSLSVIKRFGPVFKAIALKENRGVSFARNRGVEASSGKLLLFLDNDCQASRNWVESMASALSEKGVGAVAGATFVPKSGFFANAVAELGFPGGANAGFENMWTVSQKGFTNHFSGCNLGIKRPLLEAGNGFDQSMPRGEDAWCSVVLSRNNIKIKHCPNSVVFHKPMASFKSFALWHFKRGKANYFFWKKVGSVKEFVSLRLWSSKNILRKNLFSSGLPLVFSLLFLSFVLQQAGFLWMLAKNFK